MANDGYHKPLCKLSVVFHLPPFYIRMRFVAMHVNIMCEVGYHVFGASIDNPETWEHKKTITPLLTECTSRHHDGFEILSLIFVKVSVS